MSDEALAARVAKLDLWYGEFHALRAIDLDIRAGIITGLIGPSGCGKTTLLKCLNRINERGGNVRVNGTVEVFGNDIYGKDVVTESLRRRVGMVFQRPNPLPLSIYDNVTFAVRTHEKRGKRELDAMVEESLSRVGLFEQVKDRLHGPALALQLEAQQKLCIARLLPLKPQLVLLDEPCSTLDPAGTEAVESLLRELAGEYSMVIVTHNMAQARRVSDECAYMLLGEVIEAGPTGELFTSPRDERTAAYLEGRFG